MDELTTWYEINCINMVQIKKVKVQRFTGSTIWIEGSNGKISRRSRNSDWRSYYPTFSEAREALMESLNDELYSLHHRAEALRGNLAKVFRLEEK